MKVYSILGAGQRHFSLASLLEDVVVEEEILSLKKSWATCF